MVKSTFKILALSSLLMTGCLQENAVEAPAATDPKQAEARLNRAGERFQEGDYKGAIELFDQLIRDNDPGTLYQAHYNKAYCYFRLRDYATVKSILDFVIKIDPGHKDYTWFRYNGFFMLGRVASKEGDNETAAGYFEKAAYYEQGHDIYNTLAYTELKLGRYDSALAHINKAIAFDTASKNAYSTRGLIHLRLNKINDAMRDVETSMQLDSLYAYPYKNRALIYLTLKKNKKACNDLEKANALGYKKYADDPDKNDVDSLLAAHCN